MGGQKLFLWEPWGEGADRRGSDHRRWAAPGGTRWEAEGVMERPPHLIWKLPAATGLVGWLPGQSLNVRETRKQISDHPGWSGGSKWSGPP